MRSLLNPKLSLLAFNQGESAYPPPEKQDSLNGGRLSPIGVCDLRPGASEEDAYRRLT
jgi:hypothetical protein